MLLRWIFARLQRLPPNGVKWRRPTWVLPIPDYTPETVRRVFDIALGRKRVSDAFPEDEGLVRNLGLL